MSYGFADLHNHQFAQFGFGGRGVFWGGAYGDITQELRWCTGAHGPGGVNDFMGNTMRTVAYKLPPGSILGHKVGGYPQFDGWPRWDSVSHQAVYEDWLYRAVEGGLRLIVMLAVNNEFFCRQAYGGLGCGDMEAVDRQLQAAKAMEAYIDGKSGGPGQGWYRIVYTPQEARTVIAAGKLAVVLGIEVDYLFNCRSEGDLTADQLRQELDRYYALGVRHIFPIHFSNNGFGGTAFQNALIRSLEVEPISARNPVGTIGAYIIGTQDAQALGYEYRTGQRNIQGLTDLGKTLIQEMIARGMVIDIDHMSAYSKADVLDICEAANYPVVASHCAFVEICRGDKRHEGQLLPEEVERIRRVGGMVAVIVRQGTLEEIDTWRGPGQTVVEHTCGGTSNTLVQAYLYAVAKMPGVSVGFGTDMNGFAGLPGPQQGVDACPGGGGPGAGIGVSYPFTATATGQQMDRSVVGDKIFDINTDGLAHIGMLPDLLADFEAMGLTSADLDPLLNSAEGYVALLERSWFQGITSRDGILLREESGAIFVIFGGAKFHVPNMDILNRLFDTTMIQQVWNGALDAIPTISRDGTLLREESGAIFVIFGGAKFHIPNMDILNRLFDTTMIRQVWNGALDAIPPIPRDGTLLREESGAIFVIFGGAKFHIPNMDILNRLFDTTMIRQVWNGALDAIPPIPRDGTLLREESGAIFVIFGGAKFHIPNMDILNRLFDTTMIRQVWNGALDAIPPIPRDGTLLREESGAIFVIFGGAKFHIPNMDVFNRLFNATLMRQMWDGALDTIPPIPRDGTLLREESGAIFVIFGGAKFHVPNMDILNRLFDTTMIRQVWNGALDAIPPIPRDGTLLREESGAIFVIFGGAKFHIPNMDILNRLFDATLVRQVWDGALDTIPPIPRDGTLLREESGIEVYIIQGGHKIPAVAFSPTDVRVLWNGGLAGIP